MKEDFLPKGVSQFLHSLAPFMAVVPIFLAFAVIPLAPQFTLFGYQIHPQVAPLNAGVLFIFAMGSLAVYGVILAAYTGRNKFSMLGGLRASAQMISYELAMGLSFVTLVMLYGTLDLYQIIEEQSKVNPHFSFLPNWGIFYQPIVFIALLIVGMAETKRGPFDLPEAESELTAGYFTEYSGMKFLLFWLAEFAEITLFSFIIVIFFFGGWDVPYFDLAAPGSWLAALLGHLVLIGKVVAVNVFQIIVRWTLPRFRYDQLMNFGWKIIMPVCLVNLILSAIFKIAF
jgi:NADH-quinone oxidoreductase subunit H